MIVSCHSGHLSCFIARISTIEMLRYFQMYLVISVKQANWFHFMSLFRVIQEVYGRAEVSAPRWKVSLLNHLECRIEGKPTRKYYCSGRAFFSSPNPYTWWRQGACRKWRLTNLTCKPKEWKACSFFWFPFFFFPRERGQFTLILGILMWEVIYQTEMRRWYVVNSLFPKPAASCQRRKAPFKCLLRLI